MNSPKDPQNEKQKNVKPSSLNRWDKEMSQGNKKITTRKTPAINNKILVRTGSLRFSQKIPATNYKILVGTGT